jgi:PncC family amidohydrolase
VNQESPASELASIFKRSGFSLACAESCTGGLASARITDMAGASNYFFGGIIAYSNSAKTSLLHVDPDTIYKNGAVSEETAVAMARGASSVFKSDCAFSITGIAGPDGGSQEKPVGTVWFGFLVRDLIQAESRLFPGDRSAVRNAAVDFALTGITTLVRKKFELDNPREAGVSFA